MDETEVLFREARARRRRRRLIAAVSVVVVLILGLGVGVGIAASRPDRIPLQASARPQAPIAALSASEFSIRPVLCYAPPLSVPSGTAPLTGKLPGCGPSHALTAANIGVDPGNSGYTSSLFRIQPDPQFASYGSAPAAGDTSSSDALLPGIESTEGNVRYVLGPAAVMGSAIRSARADYTRVGQWTVDLTFTKAGTSEFDALAHQQFHSLIGVVFDGQVISAPLTQPTQDSFSSFGGQVQISGNFTRQQAKEIAARL